MRLKRSNSKRKQQEGYVLLAILFALTLLIVGLAIAAPKAATAGQRTKEDELIRRGEQYAVAIRRFYKKFGRYPSSIDQLENTNNIRFLRRRYLDPLTGKDDWAPIQFGQARPPRGFFGQKITTVGGRSPSGPGLGPSTIGQSLGGTSTSSPTDNSSATAASGANSSSTSTGFAGAGSSGITTSGISGSSSPLSSTNGPTGGAGNPLSTNQLGGRTFGGGAIVGVSVPSQKQSLKEFQQKDHYNEWQFVYDPTMDPTLRGGLGAGSATGVPGTSGSTFGPGGLNPRGLNPGGLNPGGLNPTSPMTNQSLSGTGSTTPSNPH